MQIIPPTPIPRAATPGIIFAEDFGASPLDAAKADGDGADTPQQILRIITDDDVALARDEGFAAGFSAGQEDAAAQRNSDATQALQHIAHQLDDLAERRAEQIAQGVEATARVIFATLATLLPSLSQRHAPTEIAHLLRDIMTELAPNCALTVAVSPELLEPLRLRLSELPRDQARRVALRSEDSIPIGDARLAWDGGSASRQARLAIEGVTDVLRGLGLLPQHDRPGGVSADRPEDHSAMPAVAVETENA